MDVEDGVYDKQVVMTTDCVDLQAARTLCFFFALSGICFQSSGDFEAHSLLSPVTDSPYFPVYCFVWLPCWPWVFLAFVFLFGSVLLVVHWFLSLQLLLLPYSIRFRSGWALGGGFPFLS
jgi:hypothetical protein